MSMDSFGSVWSRELHCAEEGHQMKMILNGSMTQGWMPPSLPLTSLGDALIFEDFCVSSCPGAE